MAKNGNKIATKCYKMVKICYKMAENHYKIVGKLLKKWRKFDIKW